MPVYEPPKQRWGWGHYLAVGCGGCFLLAVLVPVIAGFVISFFAVSSLNSAMNSPPPQRTGPYHYAGWPQSAGASIPLPGSHGTLVYRGHLQNGVPHSPQDGERGLKLISGGRTQEWPLPDCDKAQVKVDVYWHPAKAGKGPFVRFVDHTSESVLDLGRREVGSVCRSSTRAFMADYAYNNNAFSAVTTEKTSASSSFTSPNGKPAIEITAILEPANCTRLGSVFRDRRKLVFQPVVEMKP